MAERNALLLRALVNKELLELICDKDLEGTSVRELERLPTYGSAEACSS